MHLQDLKEFTALFAIIGGLAIAISTWLFTRAYYLGFIKRLNETTLAYVERLQRERAESLKKDKIIAELKGEV